LTQHLSEPLSEEIALIMRGFRQGDVLPGITQIVVYGSEGSDDFATPTGVVVVSQTCDVVRESLLYVHVAPRRRLPDNEARQARRGRRPRYVHLSAIGENDFVDLAQICSVHKSVVAPAERIAGVTSDEDISRFGKAVARHFNRFAYPDDVSIFLNPLADAIQSKSGKLESPEGRLLENVLQLRVESLNGWGEPPYDMRQLIIVEPGTLPMFPNDELPEFDESLQTWLYNGEGVIQRTSHDIAQKLEAEQDAAARYLLWAALGDAWVARCTQRAGEANPASGPP
jgi:hypothetical protein